MDEPVWHEACDITDLYARAHFYRNLAPPSSPPTPAPTEQGQLAAYDPKTAKTAIQRNARGYARRLASLMVKITQKSLGKN